VHKHYLVVTARKLLVAVWHVLTQGCADRFPDPDLIARKLLRHTYRLGRTHRPDGQTAAQYLRQQLDCLGLGADLTAVRYGSKTIALPPSRLTSADN
jgi:hypothetical protein